MKKRMIDVLLVDDDQVFLESVKERLRLLTDEFNIITAGSAEKALDLLGVIRVDIVVTDLNMPGMDGFELLDHLRPMRKTNPGMKTIVVSACDRASVEHRLKHLRFVDYLEKPLDPGVLAEAIRRASAMRRRTQAGSASHDPISHEVRNRGSVL